MDREQATILASLLESALSAIVKRKACAVRLNTGTCQRRLSHCRRRADIAVYTSGEGAGSDGVGSTDGSVTCPAYETVLILHGSSPSQV